MYKMNLGKIKIFGVIAVVLAVAGFASSAEAAPAKCSFDVNLEVGSTGESVRCLQKFLNENGYKISETGVGSPGNETDLYGGLTKEAVKRWQAAHGITSTGTFGPISQVEYLKSYAALLSSQVSGSNSNTVTVPTVSVSSNFQSTVASAEETKARKLLKEAHDLIENTKDDIDDADDDGVDVSGARDDYEDAEEDLFDGLIAFVDRDYAEAIDSAQDAVDTLNDISDDLNGDDSDAEDAIDDARQAIEDAQDDIDEADDDGERVVRARDLLDDAENKLEDAEDAFDDRNYDEAETLAKRAESLADDASDAIGE